LREVAHRRRRIPGFLSTGCRSLRRERAFRSAEPSRHEHHTNLGREGRGHGVAHHRLGGAHADLAQARCGASHASRGRRGGARIRRESQRSVLQHRARCAPLSAPGELAPTHADLVPARARKAVEGGLRAWVPRPRCQLRLDPECRERAQQHLRHQRVAGLQAGRKVRLWRHDGVGEVGSVQHGPAAGGASHHANARVLAGFRALARERLRVAEREPGAAPGIQTQRRHAAGLGRGQQRLVHRHVPHAVRRRIQYQTPGPRHGVSACGGGPHSRAAPSRRLPSRPSSPS